MDSDEIRVGDRFVWTGGFIATSDWKLRAGDIVKIGEIFGEWAHGKLERCLHNEPINVHLHNADWGRLPREQPVAGAAVMTANPSTVTTPDGRTWRIPPGKSASDMARENPEFAKAAGAHEAPPKCEPNCTPATPCLTALVCPAHREAVISMKMVENRLRWPFTNCTPDDVLEACQWRSERYEPTTSGRGGMVGIYRYDRR